MNKQPFIFFQTPTFFLERDSFQLTNPNPSVFTGKIRANPRHQGRVRELFREAFLLQIVDPHRPILGPWGFPDFRIAAFFLLHVVSFQGGRERGFTFYTQKI